MKKPFVIFISVTVAALLCVTAAAAGSEYEREELSEAVSIMEECCGEPGPDELERLHGLGLTDEDIDGLSIVSTLRKDGRDPTPYVVISAAIAVLSAAAVICTVRLRRRRI
ncbi:MAG: hypothetical protein J5879_09545 [Clostridia bacterium]|nr:hypothetical protein [Clostridia bacterium]